MVRTARLQALVTLGTQCGLVEADVEDANHFVQKMLHHLDRDPTELDNVLVEMGFPVEAFKSEGDYQVAVSEFLLTEVMAKRLASHVGKQRLSESPEESLNVVVAETAKALKINEGFFEKCISYLSSCKALPKPLLSKPLRSAKEWNKLSAAIDKMCKEFDVRQSLILTRFSATVKSFLWSEEAKKKETAILQHLHSGMSLPSLSSKHFLLALLTATGDDAFVRKVSTLPPASRLVQNPLTKYKVGRVPDRGGRPYEQAPPPPEMPPWQQRQAPSQHFQRGGGGGGGGGGRGYHQNKFRGGQGHRGGGAPSYQRQRGGGGGGGGGGRDYYQNTFRGGHGHRGGSRNQYQRDW